MVAHTVGYNLSVTKEEHSVPRVVHFEIPADNPERAIEFYGSLFGWQFQKWDGPMPYWLIDTGPGVGINGGLLQKNAPDHPIVNTIDVENLDDMIQRVQAAGGTIVVPKMPVPSVGWLAYFKDLDGNIVGMMQSDPSAGQ
jgi:predicted enzyme related to lactoylglutathione lyase